MQVDTEFAAGRYREARKASENGKNINALGITIGVIIMLINVLIVIFFIASASSSQLMTMAVLC